MSPDSAKYLVGARAKSYQVENHSFSLKSKENTHTYTPFALQGAGRGRRGIINGRKALTFTEWLGVSSWVVEAAAF